MLSPTNFTSPKSILTQVDVRSSPASSGHCLTGDERVASDNAADVFNEIQHWNNHQISGMAMVNKIYALKLSTMDQINAELYPEGLQELCNDLEILCKKMVVCVDRLITAAKHFEGLRKLIDFRQLPHPLFLTWKMDKFAAVTLLAAQSYEKELKLKMYIKESLAHASTKEQLMFFCTLWAHQPYIESQLEFEIECLLAESGHRNV